VTGCAPSVLDELLESGLLVGDGAQVRFRHEIARLAVVLRYAAAAARRAARLASHREAAAQYERALRFSGGADPVMLAGLHEGLADEIGLLDRWHDAETAGERALALWREAGDRLREGDALRRLSRIRWKFGPPGDHAANLSESIMY
jgi:hypothetical protein